MTTECGEKDWLLSDDDIESLVLIRHFELLLLRMFEEGKLNGTTHTCIGQEYIPVALAPLLVGDLVLSNHRGHGHYLAHFRDPAGLLAEIMGRTGAVCSGVGGSQHIYRDGFLSTGVQGESLPLAVGMALHHKHAASGAVAVVYIGDGTWGEGSIYEALNLAALWQVPLLVVVEHNGIAQSTPTATHLAGTIGDRVRAFGVEFTEVTTRDIPAIRAQAQPVIERVRHEQRPAVIQFDTVRLGPHSKGDDTRPADEIETLWSTDWHSELDGSIGPRFRDIDQRIRAELDQLAADIEGRPPTVWADLAGSERV